MSRSEEILVCIDKLKVDIVEASGELINTTVVNNIRIRSEEIRSLNNDLLEYIEEFNKIKENR